MEPRRPSGPSPIATADLVVRSLRLLIDFFSSLPTDAPGAGGSIAFSTSPTAPAARAGNPTASIASVVQGAALIGLTLPLSWAERIVRQATRWTGTADLERALPSLVEPVRHSLRAAVRTHAAARRSYELVELVTANLVGVMVDGLLTNPDGFGAINHLDYREWLLRARDGPRCRWSHRSSVACTTSSSATRAEIPPARASAQASAWSWQPRCSSEYSGALFWKMQAGMGEVIFAPLFEVLRERGVEFRFFHRVDALRLSEDGHSIAAIDLGVQADLAEEVGAYDPLIRVKGLPCWPDAPLGAQLQATEPLDGVDLESLWSPRRDVGRRTLEAGKDFDIVVFAISLGMVPYVCSELVDASPAWRSMVDNVGTVATQALQLWLSEDERALGWSGPAGVTVSGFVKPFDTWASMSHLLPLEDWPEADQPQSIAYFCGVLATPNALGGHAGPCAREPRRARAGPGILGPRHRDAVAGRRR